MSGTKASDFTHIFRARDIDALLSNLESGAMRPNIDFCIVDNPQSGGDPLQYALLYSACYFEWPEAVALLVKHMATLPKAVDLDMDAFDTPHELLVERTSTRMGHPNPSVLHYMIALLGENEDIDARLDGGFRGTALMFAAQAGYVHGARLLVEKYKANPMLSLQDESKQKKRKRGDGGAGGSNEVITRKYVSALDYALESLCDEAYPRCEEGEALSKKRDAIERLTAMVEYLREFERKDWFGFGTDDEDEDDEDEGGRRRYYNCGADSP